MNDGNRTKLEFVEGLVESLRSSPKEPELWSNVADVLTEAGQFERAVRAYDLALQLDPRFHRAQIGRTIALDLCDEDMTRREPPQMRSVAWDLLQVLEALLGGLREGRPGLFVDVPALRLQKATARRLALDPNDPDGLFLRSAMLATQGAFEEAIGILDRLCTKEIDYPGAREFRAQLREMHGASAA